MSEKRASAGERTGSGEELTFTSPCRGGIAERLLDSSAEAADIRCNLLESSQGLAERNHHESPRHRYAEVRHPRSPGQGDRGRAPLARVEGVASVRQGKVFDISSPAATARKPKRCSSRPPTKLLANTVIENYRVEVTG